MSKKVHVKGYYRSNGTYVAPHTRSAPTARGSGASTSACKSRTSSSSSCSTSGSTGVVYVRGYTRSNGTYVAPHTRSAPTKQESGASSSTSKSCTSSSNSCSTNDSTDVVYVRGYTRSNGTYVAPHTRSAPRKQSSSSTCSSSSSRGAANVSGHSTGTCAAPIAIKVAPQLMTNCPAKSSGTETSTSKKTCQRLSKPTKRCSTDDVFNHKLGHVGATLKCSPLSSGKCYIDNAHNRRLGRVGKPIPVRYVRQRQIIEKKH